MADPSDDRTRHGDDDVVRRIRYATRDLDVGIDLLSARYAEVHMPSSTRPRRFEMRLTADTVDTASGPMSVDRMSLAQHLAVASEPMSSLAVVIPRSGRIRIRSGRDEVDSGVLLGPTTSAFGADLTLDLDLVIGTLDLTGVRRIGAELSGLDPAAITFGAMAPVSPALGRHMADMVATVKRTLFDSDGALSSPLVRAHAFRSLAGALLAAFPNPTHAPGPRPRHDAEPATVRRAVEFIDAHAAEPIGPTDIAAAARTSPRGLQYAFARHRDTTPMGYLRQVRFERVRADLRAADPARGDTVATVALRWGFHHPSRFADGYRRRFGEHPSATLRC